MSEKLDRISRTLAGGMSRRKAFWQLLTGAGAATGLALLTPQKAGANAASCPSWCFQQSNIAFTDCMEEAFDLNYLNPVPFIVIISACLSFEGRVLDACTRLSLACPPTMCRSILITQGPGEIDFKAGPCVKPNI